MKKKKKAIYATSIFYKGKKIKGYATSSEVKKIIKRGKKYA